MTDEGYFLSSENPIANIDERAMEDTALRLLRHPEVEKAKGMASYLFREVFQRTAGEQMARFEDAIDEYVFHYAMRAAASDGQHPGVLRFMTPPHHWFGRDVPGSRWGADSPDFAYRIIPVSSDGRYEIHGRPTCDKPPTAHYALMADNTAAPTIISLLDGLDVVTDANGEFTITVDAEPAGERKNHIQTRPGAFQIWIRDAMGDWVEQSPNALRVTRLNPPQRDPLSDDELAQWAARALLDGVYYHYYLSAGLTLKEPNELHPPGSSAALGGMASQYTCSANIVLDKDEALIITASGSGALFRNAVLVDVFMNTLNYWDHTSSLNHAQMEPDENGLFTYVVAHEDPGVHNWLDTTGFRQTIFGQRWQSFPGGAAKEIPTIEGRVVKFKNLSKELPKGVRMIDAAAREQQLAARRAGFDKRFVDR
ncbi:MAG: hypothetical protein R3E09_14850 [Novosphingobium sp.]|nr:hypothetical protein [Novosphingobium sp.]